MKTIIWDLDNTITDTEEFHRRAWQEIMRRYDLEIL
ncbi:MAG: HAD hydrolase-like protein [Anaerolineales bacterium]|nr:HAD hydrolase-like protein [Anaerolineales bacterium]